MPHKFIKYKLLLDENLPPREKLPRLNHRYDVKHIAHDYNKAGLSDQKVYDQACREERLIITINETDFFVLAKKKKPCTGILSISGNLSTEQIDKKVTALLQRKTKKQLYGHIATVTGESKI